jgi:hypothetical protein
MVEAKIRIMSVDRLATDQRGIPSPLVFEYGALQIRMVCEIIALSCLVAHGELVSKSRPTLRKEYAPGQIFMQLEKLHPDFYPTPFKPVYTNDVNLFGEYDGPPFLSKDEVSQTWSKCGNVLHRGNLKGLIREKTPTQARFKELENWCRKILNLLNTHYTRTVDDQWFILCSLKSFREPVEVALAGKEADKY